MRARVRCAVLLSPQVRGQAGVTHQLIVSHRRRPLHGTVVRRMVVNLITHVEPMRICDLLWIYIALNNSSRIRGVFSCGRERL